METLEKGENTPRSVIEEHGCLYKAFEGGLVDNSGGEIEVKEELESLASDLMKSIRSQHKRVVSLLLLGLKLLSWARIDRKETGLPKREISKTYWKLMDYSHDPDAGNFFALMDRAHRFPPALFVNFLSLVA